MDAILETTAQYLMSHLWIVQIAVVIIVTAIASRVRYFVLKRVNDRLSTQGSLLNRSVCIAIRTPLAALIWIAGSLFAIDIIRLEFELSILEAIPAIRYVALIVVMTWFAIRLVNVYERGYIADKRDTEPGFDITTAQITTKVLKICAVVLGALIAMQTLGMNIAGLVAFGGVGGIAVGFASRELIANYFGGLMIYLDQPFKVGETIDSSDRDIHGTVMDIGWRQTIVQKFDTRTLYVPNSAFTTIAVRNLTRQTHRRIYEYVGIRYDDAGKIDVIVNDVREMLHNHPDIAKDNSVMVSFDRFAASSLDFFIYCFTKTTVWAEYHAVKQDVLFKIIEIVDNHGAQIAFPTSTIHLADGSSLKERSNTE